MADQLERTLLLAEIAELQKQQTEAKISAIYAGWTREEESARHKRDARIAFLLLHLAALDGSPHAVHPQGAKVKSSSETMNETIRWQNTWEKIIKLVEQDVSELNSSREAGVTGLVRTAESPSDTPVSLQIASQGGPFERVAVEIDPQTGTIKFEEGSRTDTFVIGSDGFVVLKEHLAGEPIPSKDPMTVEQFSKFVLTKQPASS